MYQMSLEATVMARFRRPPRRSFRQVSGSPASLSARIARLSLRATKLSACDRVGCHVSG